MWNESQHAHVTLYHGIRNVSFTYIGSRVFESHVFKASRFSMIIFRSRGIFLRLYPSCGPVRVQSVSVLPGLSYSLSHSLINSRWNIASQDTPAGEDRRWQRALFWPVFGEYRDRFLCKCARTIRHTFCSLSHFREMATVYTLAANLAIAVSKLLGAFTLVADLAIAVTELLKESRQFK